MSTHARKLLPRLPEPTYRLFKAAAAAMGQTPSDVTAGLIADFVKANAANLGQLATTAANVPGQLGIEDVGPAKEPPARRRRARK